MNSTAIYSGVIPGISQAQSAESQVQTQETGTSKKSFIGFLNSLAAASGNPAALEGEPIVSKKQAMAGLQLSPSKTAAPSAEEKLDVMTKSVTKKLITGLMPGATAAQVNEMKVKFSANINSLEKAMKSVLQQHGIPSPDIQVMPPEMIMVNLPDGLMEKLSNVLGAFVSGFDNASGTSFAKNLKIAMQNLATDDGKDLKVDFNGFSPQNELDFVEAAIATVTTMMGVERPAKNSAPTATQTLMIAQSNPVLKAASGKPPIQASQNTQQASKGMLASSAPIRQEAQSIPAPGSFMVAPSNWAPDETMEEGLKNFMRSTLFAAEATAKVGAEISKAVASGAQLSSSAPTVSTAAVDVTMIKPGTPEFARIETFEAINQLSADSVSAEDFEEILSNATKSKTTSDALTQNQANRFANLINSQIKNVDLGDRKTRIELAPKGLGEIEINIENDASGKMRAVIRVENPAVLELMKTDKSQLMDLLSQKGIDLGDGTLDFEGFDKEDGGDADAEGQGDLMGENGRADGSEGSNTTEDDPGPKITDTTVDIQI
jgi:flagellar hook-length control protein FliK